MANPVHAENLRDDVDAALARHIASLSQEVAAISPEAPTLVGALEQLLDGGKRFRATFAYWAFRACGGQPTGPERQAVVRAAAALELFQASALFHDDVLDCSDTRRGRPSAHVAFAAAHAADELAGDPEHFGLACAILLGDLALTAASREFTQALAALSPSDAANARAVFEAMTSEVQIGQYLDVLAQALPFGKDPSADERRAKAIVQAKSASYSVRCPAQIGARMAGCDDATYGAISDFGAKIGEAFQLRDDILGVFGNPEVTGKPAGGDLIEGKRTVLVARAMRDGGDARTLIMDGLGRADLTQAQIADLTHAIETSGALASLEATIVELHTSAIEALDVADLNATGREMLLAMADAAAYRGR